MSVSGMTIVNFEDFDVEGVEAAGSISYIEGQNNIMITMEY